MNFSLIISIVIWIITGIISWNLIDPQNFGAGVFFIIIWFIIGNIAQFIAGSISAIIIDQIPDSSNPKPIGAKKTQSKINIERIPFENKTTYPLANYIIKALLAYEKSKIEYSSIISLLSTDLKAKIQIRQNIKFPNQVSNLLFLLLSCCFLSILFEVFREKKLDKFVNKNLRHKIADEILNSFLKRESNQLNLSDEKYASLFKGFCDNIVDLSVSHSYDQNLIRLTDKVLFHLKKYSTNKELTINLVIDYFESFKISTDTRLAVMPFTNN